MCKLPYMAKGVKNSDIAPYLVHEYGGNTMSAVYQSRIVHTTIKSIDLDNLLDWANQFYQSKKVEGVSSYTLTFYKQQLGHFMKYCDAQVFTQFEEITPNVIR